MRIDERGKVTATRIIEWCYDRLKDEDANFVTNSIVGLLWEQREADIQRAKEWLDPLLMCLATDDAHHKRLMAEFENIMRFGNEDKDTTT